MKTDNLVVLFADISGSTQLYEALGDARAVQEVGRCIARVIEVVKDTGGTVVKTIGDEVMGTFPGPEEAVQAAAAIQEAVREEMKEQSAALKLSVGLHFGQVVLEEGDVFGDTVNIASRLVSMANPGQILTSRSITDRLPDQWSSRTRDIGKFPIKGKREMMRVYEVLLSETQRDPELTLAPRRSGTMEMPKVFLLLRHDQTEILIHDEKRSVAMGRDPDLELFINDKMASRNHARIEFAGGKFHLEDHSTNGTYVLTHEGAVVHLRREGLMLSGNGQISLGRAFTDNPTELVQFYLNRVEDQ